MNALNWNHSMEKYRILQYFDKSIKRKNKKKKLLPPK